MRHVNGLSRIWRHWSFVLLPAPPCRILSGRCRARQCAQGDSLDGPQAELVVEEGAEKGRVLTLRASKNIEIGREGNFRLEDKALSRHHARISWDGSAFRIEDAGSSWGTFVNGMRIKSHALRPGDRVKIGSHVLVFSLEEEIPSAPVSIPTPVLLVEDDEDIPSAPAAPGRPAEPERAPEPTTAAPSPSQEVEDPEEFAVPGTCFHCGKPAPDPGPGAPPDALGRPPRSYCSSCSQQYPLLGRVLANHLAEKVLGAGGMGVVYRGTHVVMQRRAALKTLRILDDADPTMVKRLLR